MSDFILTGREFDVVPHFLLEAVPNFGQSDEFKGLDEEEQKIPGLVCAAFSKRLFHLHQALSQTGEAQHVELEQCYAAMKGWLRVPIRK